MQNYLVLPMLSVMYDIYMIMLMIKRDVLVDQLNLYDDNNDDHDIDNDDSDGNDDKVMIMMTLMWCIGIYKSRKYNNH